MSIEVILSGTEIEKTGDEWTEHQRSMWHHQAYRHMNNESPKAEERKSRKNT